MDLPYYLQKLPSEGRDLLRFLAQRGGPASVPEIETGAGFSNRMVMRTIRRLVNEGHVEMRGGLYALTGDGEAAAQQLAELEANMLPSADAASPVSTVRRLAIVMPRNALSGSSAMLFFGVNAPEMGAPRLAAPVRVELRISAVGGNLSVFKVEIDVPPDRAARPARVDLTPAEAGRSVRVRVDAAQIGPGGDRLPLGGTFFDVRVPSDASSYDPTPTAVGMDVPLTG